MSHAAPITVNREAELNATIGVGSGGFVRCPSTTLALPGLESESVRLDDIILTPLDVARDVVKHFAPSGRILDPCRGNGAFADLMPGCEWCEIRQGRDFYAWREPVDWIVSNLPKEVREYRIRRKERNEK